MAKCTFKQFQAEYPNDAACLARIMEIQYGGDETHARLARNEIHPRNILAGGGQAAHQRTRLGGSHPDLIAPRQLMTQTKPEHRLP
jgi:hypothetical protein